MHNRFQYTSIKTVLAKFYRDVTEKKVSEGDILEWASEAMGFFKMASLQEEAVSFLEVKNYQTELPQGFQAVVQLAKNNAFIPAEVSANICQEEASKEKKKRIEEEIVCEKTGNPPTTIFVDSPINVPPTSYRIEKEIFTEFLPSTTSFVGANGTANIYVANWINGGIVNGEGLTSKTYYGSKLTISNSLGKELIIINPTLTVNVQPPNVYSIDIFLDLNNQIERDIWLYYFNNLSIPGSHVNLNGTPTTQAPLKWLLQRGQIEENVPGTIEYKALRKYTHYEDNQVVKVTYKDSYGTTYVPTGEIGNCPDGVCDPCNKCYSPDIIVLDEDGVKVDAGSYHKFFTVIAPYKFWVQSAFYKQQYTPIRLSNHTFFNSLVCKEGDDRIYRGIEDEYTLIGSYPELVIRFNFSEGQVALSYLKAKTDEEGFPLIPDDVSCLNAVTYYVKWKLAERYRWERIEGFERESKDAEDHWLKYCKQFKNKVKMPFGIDEYSNLRDSQYYMIPRFDKHIGFFGQLGRQEHLFFNNTKVKRFL